MSIIDLNSAQICTGLNPQFNNLSCYGQMLFADSTSSTTAYAVVVDGSNNLQIFTQTSGSDVNNPISIAPTGEVTIPSLSIPGGDVLSVGTQNGSGIAVTGTSNVLVTSSLVAGSGIALTPSTSDTTLLITSTGSGVASLTAGTNITLSGTSTNPIISATGAIASLTAGTNITLSGTSTNPIISATGGGGGGVSSVSSVTGSGISVDNTDSANPKVATSLVGNNHIVITPSLSTNQVTIGYDLMVPTVQVTFDIPLTSNSGTQYTPGFQPIQGTASNYFTLTAGIWLCTLQGGLSLNTYNTVTMYQLYLQQQTTNTVYGLFNAPVPPVSFSGGGCFNGDSTLYVSGTVSLGLNLVAPWGGSPYGQSAGSVTITCYYLGNTQSPLSSGTPYT